MKIEQFKWTQEDGWGDFSPKLTNANLVLVFGSRAAMSNQSLLDKVKIIYPNAVRCGSTTSGEIYGTRVIDDSIVVTAIEFSNTKIRSESIDTTNIKNTDELAKSLKEKFPEKDLVHLFVLLDGLEVSGSQLVESLKQAIPSNIAVTGGCAGDGSDFKKTLVYYDNDATSKRIVALGFYGTKIKIGYGSMGGWDPYGPVSKITKSKDNLVYEIDGRPAADLYIEYIGEDVFKIPGSALLFPLTLKRKNFEEPIVRTILGVNREDKTILFAGDVPEGSDAQFMKANFNRLIAAAGSSGKITKFSQDYENADLAILVSCVGRKLVLKQRVEEEVEAVQEELGKKTCLAGFYSYGEISPFKQNTSCELHNQTMTITTFKEFD